MTLNFPGTGEDEPKHTEFHEKIIDRAAQLMADTCNEQKISCIGREIPDDAILLALSEEPEVAAYIEYLGVAGANEEKLKAVIEADFNETMIPSHSSPADTQVSKDDIAARALSSKVAYILNKTGNPNEYDPSWVFHMMLTEKTATSSFRSDYTSKNTGAGLDMENMVHARHAICEHRTLKNDPDQPAP